jgi:hypothetical protein
MLEQSLNGSPELSVQGIFVKLVGKELHLIQNAICVGAVLSAQKLVAAIIQRVEVVLRNRLHDVALLAQAPTNVAVDGPEPVAQLFIPVGITVDLVESLKEIIRARAIGEALQQSLELVQRRFVRVIGFYAVSFSMYALECIPCNVPPPCEATVLP